MPNGSFTIGSTSQKVNISTEHIKTSNNGLLSFIELFLDLNLKLNQTSPTICYDFISIRSKLFLFKENIFLSESFEPFTINLDNEPKETGVWLTFSLNSSSIFTIQKNRDGGDIKFLIRFSVIAVRKRNHKSNESATIWSFENTETLKGEVQIDIPKSIWVENLFPKLGYHGFKLFEIPLKHNLLEEAYDDIILEFNQAETYFNKQDYNKCIAHCRHTLDAINRNLRKIKDGNESETAFKWLTAIDHATLTWIDEISKSLSSISSKTHHPGLKKDFTRQEAESVYLVTLGLMNFIGQASSDYR